MAPPPPGPQQRWGAPPESWSATSNVDPLSDDPDPFRQPRIAPSTPARRSRLVPGLLIGLLVGILAGGSGGYLAAAGTDNTEKPSGGQSSAPGGSTAKSLSPYESSRLTLNKAKFDGELADIAAPWLAAMGGCISNVDPGGPKLNPGEKVHVFCRHGGVSLHFVSFNSSADRDAARLYRQRLSLENNTLAPGMAESGQAKTGGSTKANGRYVEYAYLDPDRNAFAGIWWDRDDKPVSVSIEGLWDLEFGAHWEPLRGLWQQYS